MTQKCSGLIAHCVKLFALKKATLLFIKSKVFVEIKHPPLKRLEKLLQWRPLLLIKMLITSGAGNRGKI